MLLETYNEYGIEFKTLGCMYGHECDLFEVLISLVILISHK